MSSTWVSLNQAWNKNNGNQFSIFIYNIFSFSPIPVFYLLQHFSYWKLQNQKHFLISNVFNEYSSHSILSSSYQMSKILEEGSYCSYCYFYCFIFDDNDDHDDDGDDDFVFVVAVFRRRKGNSLLHFLCLWFFSFTFFSIYRYYIFVRNNNNTNKNSFKQKINEIYW